jgi:phosphoglycolate phosphatase
MKAPLIRPCRLFIFDLDGTLINSRADIALSLNNALTRIQLPTLPESCIADFVGEGVPKLVQRAIHAAAGGEPEAEVVAKVISLFQEEYGLHLLDQTRLFPDTEVALSRLSWARFAVVTNKPEAFSRRILDGLGIGHRFSAVLGGDSIKRRKPDPEALLAAMQVCQATPSETAMVGDSGVDIQAGKAAGVATCGVLGGFRPKEELEAAHCDLIIDNLIELANHFGPA